MDLKSFRSKFPLLRQPHPRLPAGRPLIYLDSACSALKPDSVIGAISKYYSDYPACAGRAHHSLAELANQKVRAARQNISSFIGVRPSEIVFLKNATEGINLVANSLIFNPGDAVLVTDKEHNSNLLPWLHPLCHSRAGRLPAGRQGNPESPQIKILPTHSGQIKISELEAILKTNPNIKLLSLGLTSSLDGQTISAKKIINLAHQHGCQVLLDATQSLLHQKVNAKSLGADFLVFSANKICGPTGLGVLYVKNLSSLKPFLLGGGTIKNLTNLKPEFLSGPDRFEAGSQNYAGIIGTGAAVEFLNQLDFKAVQAHETELKNLLQEELSKIPGLHLTNPTPPKTHSAVVSFYIAGHDSHSLAIKLDQKFNIALRSGSFCNHHYFAKHNLPPLLRVSLAFYNTKEEVKFFLSSLKSLIL